MSRKINNPYSVSVSQMVAKFQSVIGLNMSDIAATLQVTHQNLHRHKRGEVPAATSMDRYRELNAVTTMVEEQYPKAKLGLRNVVSEGTTLYNHLISGEWTRESAIQIARYVHEFISNKGIDVLSSPSEDVVLITKLHSAIKTT